jgi:hypothetical protein
MKSRISVPLAIAIGTIVVNVPVFSLLMGPFFLVFYLVNNHYLPESQVWIALPSFLVGLSLAWLWWSLLVPKWRLWAYERVSDIPLLKDLAVTFGITWPDDHFFGRTEIKSREHAARESELDPSKNHRVAGQP